MLKRAIREDEEPVISGSYDPGAALRNRLDLVV